MASSTGRNNSKNGNKNTRSRSANTRSAGTRGGNARGSGRTTKAVRKNVDIAVKNEVMLIIIFAAAIFLFLCVANIIHGSAASYIRSMMFGVFGLLAYLIPIIVFLGFAFGISNKGNTVAVIKLVSGVVLVFLAGIVAYMAMRQEALLAGASIVRELYETSAEKHAGGGVLFGLLAHGLYTMIGFGGTLFVVVVLGIVSVVFITERSFLSGVKRGGTYLIETAKEDAARMREYRESLAEEDAAYDGGEEYEEEEYALPQRARRAKPPKQKQPRPAPEAAAPEEKVRRMDRKARGVVSSMAVTLKSDEASLGAKQDIHEIILLNENDAEETEVVHEDIHIRSVGDPPAIPFVEEINRELGVEPEAVAADEISEAEASEEEDFVPEEQSAYDVAAISSMPEPMTEETFKRKVTEEAGAQEKAVQDAASRETSLPEEQPVKAESAPPREYVFPPLHLLKKGEGRKGDSANQLKETALRLQQTLQNFGVRVTITDISQGPSVTRYEMQPEQGVKVSKIVGLADDIKLNLAATDIRIEAPIPGKAAVGIEVPNKENSAVALRDLLESEEFKRFPSNLCFAVGKDIAGQVVVTDIAKMPHVLIAGATGSGKSVCINTIIMSILYKANPADVKLIMIDPKVVELSVYNGIPHLMVPVVTDPKKASAALHWGVAEMTDRYKKFADLNVRDLKGYNKAVEAGKLSPDGEPLQKMPQVVIIVDELADLMMVAAGEVEESICRLAQLARACGIHLVIATQRPSVDVITGLIKANMPSRIAFSVSSGVDSRTILDMNGAEKLLGKGDMLFYPQGYSKPARVQGAFVSDSEVSDVVDFLKNQMLGNNTYNSEIEEKIKTMQTAGGASGSSGGGSDVDSYFVEAGKFVIEKDKASIGMLQRVFKIGFNRAARIVDQLEEAGVVGAEEGTKPRRILMSMEQFENYVEENV
ncbi:MAG: DNA translocase FtsK [Roseburia sp.]|nr:DNA translocase FtsK [Roseburia sp.]